MEREKYPQDACVQNEYPRRSAQLIARKRQISLMTAGAILILLCQLAVSHPIHAQEQVVELMNGTRLEGSVARKQSYKDVMFGDNDSILFVDDGLRRVFTYFKNMRTFGDSTIAEESFEVEQFGANRNPKLGGVGSILNVGPFNEFGRRTIVIMGTDSPVTLIQGIVEISPRYSILRTVETDNAIYSGLEMRIATSSIPPSTLSRVMRHHINALNVSDRLKIISFYQQSSRYHDAELELLKLIADFPELEEEKQRELKLLRQAWANQLVREMKSRVDRGQYSLAMAGIERFPRTQVASEILLEVGELKNSIDQRELRRSQIIERVNSTATKFLSETEVAAARKTVVESFQQEIETELNLNNIGRLAGFMTLSDDPTQTSDQSLALAVSGWLVGSDGSTTNVENALALLQIRELVLQYLLSTNDADREKIRVALGETEGASAQTIARIIANLKPFLQSEEVADMKGFYELKAPGIGKIESFDYWVQLPPDYDPYRRYPCVVALTGGSGADSVGTEIEWWAGPYDKKFEMRRGEAAIRGYIVIGVDWKTHGRAEHEFTIQEHAAVLNSLRDSFKRFSIDTDRVFLAGHGAGGTAAWDIGLSHPDLWAGVIPIVARADKYIAHYWRNGRNNLPMYFVIGELDNSLGLANDQDWNRYLTNGGFDVMVVEYRGRGREHFYEEIKHIYDWMELGSHRRAFTPEKLQKFHVEVYRPWDNFFWFIEIDQMRKNMIVYPQQWPQKGTKPTTIKEAEIAEKNVLRATVNAEKYTVWLAPEYIDFDREISWNGHVGEVKPDPMLLLEDVRTRCDRQHPFWAKIDPSQRPWK